MTNPSWKGLESTPKIPDEDSVQKILSRIGETPDGKKLIEYLKKSVLYQDPAPDCSDSALREHMGMRKLAKRFLLNLERPLAEPDRNPDE